MTSILYKTDGNNNINQQKDGFRGVGYDKKNIWEIQKPNNEFLLE